jgi:hypothetical protein
MEHIAIDKEYLCMMFTIFQIKYLAVAKNFIIQNGLEMKNYV